MDLLARSVQNLVQDVGKVDWEFVLGTPTRIAVIIVLAVLISFIVRVLIRRFANHIADGTVGDHKKRFSTTEKSAELLGQDPIVVQARRAQRAKTVGSLLSSIASILIVIVATLMVLAELNFNLTPLLASASVAGVAIGFGAQSMIKDYLSGFFMVIEDQYGIGDTVDLGEAVGVVEEVGLRTTRVRGVDGTLWHVRNGEILRVGNQSQGWARAVMDIPLPYDSKQDDLEALISSTTRELRKDPKMSQAILEDPEIWGVEALTGESMTIRTVIKTRPNEQWMVARAFRAELKRQMDADGIKMPFTQQTMIRTMPEPSRAHDQDTHRAHSPQTDSHQVVE